MTRLTLRPHRSSSRFDWPDADDIREQIADAVESAMDRVDELPSRSDIAKSVRRSELARMMRSAAVFSAPMAASAARSRLTRRRTSRFAAAAPVVIVRSHPVAAPLAVGVVVGAAAFAALRVVRSRRRAATARDAAALHASDTPFDTSEAIDSMEFEGGAVSGVPANGSGRVPS